MPSNIYDAYAAKVCRFFEMPAGTYTGLQLFDAVLQLPLAESHAALDGVDLETLPRLGESVALREHMQRSFFDVIGMAARQLYEMTVPVLVRRDHLERLEGWRDWRTLSVVLAQEYLEAVLVFRNAPLKLRTGEFERADYYVADVRVMLGRPEPFRWTCAKPTLSE